MGEQARPLLWWIMKLDSMFSEVWLWIPKNIEKLTLETQCTPFDDSQEIFKNEYADRENDLDKSVLMFLSRKDQLEDVEQNRKEQQPEHTHIDLMQALNYYWENDAFVEISNV